MSSRDALSRLIEGAINRYLALDEDLAAALAGLSGNVVALEVEGTGAHFACHFAAAGVLVRRVDAESGGSGAADVHIRGTPLALARLVREAGSDPTLGGQVRIHGDIDVAQRLSRALHGFEFDWEELLSQLTGDVAAHQIGRALRGAGEFVARARGSFERDLGEYLVEESALMPSRAETESFASGVDDLRDDVARLEKRVQRIAARRAGSGE